MALAAIGQTVLDAVYGTFGQAASYTPPGGGTAVDCLVQLDRNDPAATFGDAAPRAGQMVLKVRKSDIAAPLINGTFGPPTVTIAGRSEINAMYRVLDRPRLTDPAGLEWSMWVI